MELFTELVVSVDSASKVRCALQGGADAILFGGESYAHEFLSVRQYHTRIR